MRLWSFHPQYLDSKGLVAIWREALLAKNVLQEKTNGYKNHPQLERFKNHPTPLEALDHYLLEIFNEALEREYNFDKNKIGNVSIKIEKIKVTSKQIEYEFNHLSKKLKNRDPVLYIKLLKIKKVKTHPLFITIKGDIENWEKVKAS